MDENIVYFMLDIMITNNSIPTNSEIPTPFHAKKEQWLSHFKRVAYVGDHTLYTCEYMWWCERWVCVRYFSEPCSSFSSFTWLSLVLLIFFLNKIIYLFIYEHLVRVETAWNWMMEYESDRPNITFCSYFHVLCHICDIYWQLLHFKTLIIIRKKFTSKLV